MKNIPQTLPYVSVFALLGSLNAAPILPPQANENAQLNAGIRTSADFDWNTTNLINNENYFKEKSNFFVSDVRTPINYNASENAFLNAKKITINRHDKGGKSLKQFSSIFNSGHDSYNLLSAQKM